MNCREKLKELFNKTFLRLHSSLKFNMEQLNLNWHTYSEHLKEMMVNLLYSNKSSDVTLVCNDKTKFKAHKFVLRACSFDSL